MKKGWIITLCIVAIAIIAYFFLFSHEKNEKKMLENETNKIETNLKQNQDRINQEIAKLGSSEKEHVQEVIKKEQFIKNFDVKKTVDQLISYQKSGKTDSASKLINDISKNLGVDKEKLQKELSSYNSDEISQILNKAMDKNKKEINKQKTLIKEKYNITL